MRVRSLLAAALPLLWGVLAGWWTPRGPGTVGTALASVAVSLAVGLVAGWSSRSRWAMLVGPVFFALAVELVRLRLRGPTVDRPHLTGLGVAALLAGRGVHGLLALLPMLVGAAYGAGLARRLDGVPPRRPVPRWSGRVGIGLLAALLVLVSVGAAVPGRTDPIPGGIARFDTVDSGGRELGLLIRGTDMSAPVLLVVPGPPGGSEIGAVRRHLSALERHFVVAVWDRAGAPHSWSAFRAPADWRLDDEVDDLVAVARHLRERFGRDRIHLVAHSGGTTVGLLAVQRHPELFASYVGVGQVVSLREADRSQYADTVAWARRTGRTALADRMAAQGPPPYRDVWAYEALLTNEAGAFPVDRAGAGEDETGTVGNLGVPEYSPLEKVHVFGFLDGWDVLYPRLQDLDFRRDVRQLAVPARFVDGAQEVPGRLRLFDQWYAQLQAPRKDHLVIPRAGHRSLFERPAEFVTYLERIRSDGGPP
ncbi:alpha/beta hydrolase [Micromonospora sp. WMMD1128]|uniref:alpha/beta fold hydrolase n=1 Tax=unclassified Micromonospora TaxID=2617518 RepID=UPI00248CBEB5|nr:MULTISPECIES: alpha/beta hydrolase [unclassified Micromonospora]WBB72150.1 alpha/beta hydrolase [Micromonospora sp. WMMD1128]WFE34387.1 alpha/beta hydrolase [Micromonospora sp. WMMD975]